MKKIHFFKARSRLGLTFEPYGQKENNHGVEQAPDYILTPTFLNKIKTFKTSEYNFPFPENIKEENITKIIAKSISEFRDFINTNIKRGEMQIVIGGDHSVSLSSALSVLERTKTKSFGYIHFDSHGDINLFNESPSQNFHGMYLRPLFDTFDIEEINKLLLKKINPKNLLMIGNLDLNEGEKIFIENKKINTISRNNFVKNSKEILIKLKTFIKNYEYLHISFDGDVLDKTIFSATGIPAQNGFMLNEIQSMFKILKNHPHISFDICEYNPYKKGALKSKNIVQKLIMEITT